MGRSTGSLSCSPAAHRVRDNRRCPYDVLPEHELALLYPGEMAGEGITRRRKEKLLPSGWYHFYEVDRNRRTWNRENLAPH